MSVTRIRTSMVAAAALAGAMALGTVAPQASARSNPAPAPSPGAHGTFGPGCSALPRTGPGSAAVMSRTRVANAVASNPQLRQLTLALKRANLTKSLNGASNITVFAPTNAAFDKLPKSKRMALLNDPKKLRQVLDYHVVNRSITKSELSHGSFRTREGSRLTTSGSGTSFTVDRTAHITCGNIRTANATVYLVDKVLTPPSH
jgi:uncharacterized surface protein with fasciclin (FAS1) repeats